MALQLPLFAPTSDWRPPSLSELPDWSGQDKVCIDCETRDPYLKKLGIGVRREGYMIGLSFAFEDGRKYYLPFRHEEGEDNLDETQVLRYLRHQAKNFTGQIVGANLSYDLDYCLEEGIDFSQVEFFRDIQIADPLIYELHDNYSLQKIAERNNLEGKDEDKLKEAARAYGVDPKAGMWQLPARFVGAYAERDADEPLTILARQQRDISKNGLQKVFDLESRLLPVLVKMRRRGVRIDFDKLEQIETWTIKEETEALNLVKRETGYQIGLGNVWKANVLAEPLKEIGFPLGRTAGGKPSIENSVLESFDHPVATALRHARKVNRLRTTFAASIRRYQTNGRIHSTFNQIAREDEAGEQKGVRYGRLSSVHPNLQQQPSPDRDPVIAGEWRKIYLPEEGGIFGALDYKQQEPRWTTHIAAIMGLEKAQIAAKRYRDDPLTDNHDMMTELVHGDAVHSMSPKEFKTTRSHAKCIYLGLCYGEGGAKLCQDLGLPTRWALAIGQGRHREVVYFESQHEAYAARAENENGGFIWEAAGAEGQRIIDKFDAEAPFIRQLAKKATARAKQVGYVQTLLGRRLHFPVGEGGRFDWTHKALNRVIQGNGADQTKAAVIEMDKAGYFLQLQVHDEVDGTFGSVAEATAAGKIMSEAVSGLSVPFAVDVETGPTWGDAK